ncbi:D-glycero-D-manno-heptose 1,7-bisphosphate phosphatase [Bathymodiolus platifrons methanotrophic gill symbiont]|uniref:D-glycero-beta-D-manno-heptose 1,7-bisphosphate 7-phosphatase n=1 Tax=Bathymodiolus platifrons methanotrophic gill symbiont TaxID=113268 RepID=UPI000B41785C|nr:D-glycero-beta-D-manno-heptose 1,7-bisphosphate 7-phosphatase [Bathymodiolus platifrons methanotrophic gill symbiont]MCK5870675.1 D-glycero-beta-D-manno-heptose 1,7-bisphosphate 7-phosphatase [Methyloprofundus sp.]GAW87018.1 D-glycero-D-manno-heptose 1,7-bisphosphate phosphatase [Bathymodiolus platifrons methanotrophic gill symbiont]
MAQAKKYVLLDRDGVINHDSGNFIKSPDEWLPIDNSLEAIALLHRNGYQVVVITNQSGVGRGLYSDAILTDMHRKMARLTEAVGGKINHIYYCPHLPDAGCDCRKPKPGMLLQFSQDANVALDDIYFIGDSLRDIEAGIAAGAKPLLVKTGNGEKTLAANPDLNIPTFENLYDAAEYILSK